MSTVDRERSPVQPEDVAEQARAMLRAALDVVERSAVDPHTEPAFVLRWEPAGEESP
ncbi:MAG TPA: hypothetical protein VIN09_12110 [Chloroflexota bacterium]|jgi:hypothetical protein